MLRVPTEPHSADAVLGELERIDTALRTPDAAVEALVAAVAALDVVIRASASSWSLSDGQRVLERFNSVLAVAVERRGEVLSVLEHQTSGRRAVARYQGR